jgi:hypothetical protein
VDKRRLLYEYMGYKCAHCGKTVQEVLAAFGTMSQVFHFNHVKPEKKHQNYDTLIRRFVSTEVLDEVDKCVLLCSICHGVLHGQRGQGTLTITNVVRGKKLSQTINGQIIMQLPLNESEKPKIGFFSDEKINILPYRVYCGGKRPKILTSGELEQDNRLLRFMFETKNGQQFELRNLDGNWLLHVERADDELLKVTARFSFSLNKAELFGDDGEPAVWVRNGRALVNRKGTIGTEGQYSLHVAYLELEKALSGQR